MSESIQEKPNENFVPVGPQETADIQYQKGPYVPLEYMGVAIDYTKHLAEKTLLGPEPIVIINMQPSETPKVWNSRRNGRR